MNKEQIASFCERYFAAAGCDLIEKTPDFLHVKLSPEADRELTGRTYYWHFVERTGAEPETMSFRFIFDPESYERKKRKQEGGASGPASPSAQAAQTGLIGLPTIAPQPGRTLEEPLVFGTRRLEQLYASACRRGACLQLFEELPSPASAAGTVPRSPSGTFSGAAAKAVSGAVNGAAQAAVGTVAGTVPGSGSGLVADRDHASGSGTVPASGSGIVAGHVPAPGSGSANGPASAAASGFASPAAPGTGSVTAGQSVSYATWLGVNYKISYICDRKREELLSLGIHLSTGEIADQFFDKVKHRNLSPRMPPRTMLGETISLERAARLLEQKVMEHLKRQDYAWAEEARRRLAEEEERLDAYYGDLLKAAGLAPEDRDEIIAQRERRREEIRWQHEPRIDVCPVNYGLFHLLEDTFLKDTYRRRR